MENGNLGSNLPIGSLLEEQTTALAELKKAQARAKMANAAVSDALSILAQTAFKTAGKSHGSIAFDVGDGVEARSEIRKSVTWDDATLRAVAKAHWDQLKHIVKSTVSIPEKEYARLTPELREAVDAARFVDLSEPKTVLRRAES